MTGTSERKTSGNEPRVPEAERLTPDELRTLFLFESLDEGQLELLAEHGRVERWASGTGVFTEGEPATCFFVLLSGTITLSQRVRAAEVEIFRTDQRGAYAGFTQAH